VLYEVQSIFDEKSKQRAFEFLNHFSLSVCKTKKWQKLQKSPTNDEKKQAVGF
jgi:hypothetical protein